MNKLIKVEGKVGAVSEERFGSYVVEVNTDAPKKIKVVCPSIYKIEEDDMVSLKCEQNGGIYHVKEEPKVYIGTERETLVRCFMEALHGKKFDSRNANRLYDFFDRVKKEKGYSSTDDCVSGVLDSFIRNEGTDETDELKKSSGLGESWLRCILKWWMEHRDYRKLYHLGITKKEADECLIPPYEVHKVCLDNPYKLLGVPIEKCESIIQKLDIEVPECSKFCGEVIRHLQENLLTKRWVGTPERLLSEMYGPENIEKNKDLMKSFGVHFYERLAYNNIPFLVEMNTAEIVKGVMCRNKKTWFSGEYEPNYINRNLTEVQKKAVKTALTENMSVITGGAGTGKTTVIKELVNNFEIHGIPYMVTSFTGKAVARLREVLKSKLPMTMHCILSRYDIYKELKWEYLIIDEISMVTTRLMYDFLRVFTSSKYNIVLVGDENQLQPIEWGSFYEQILAVEDVPVVKLDTVFRFFDKSKDNSILINTNNIIDRELVEGHKDKNSTALDIPTSVPSESGGNEPLLSEYRTQPGAKKGFEWVESEKFVMNECKTTRGVEKLVENFKKWNIPVQDFTVVSPYNSTVDSINVFIQNIYNEKEEGVLDRNGDFWKVGDKVMMVKNHYGLNIMNGEEGCVKCFVNKSSEYGYSKQEKKLTVDFGMGRVHDFDVHWNKNTKKYTPEYGGAMKEPAQENDGVDTRLLKKCSSITGHKSQGSEWPFLVVYIPNSPANKTFLNWKYIYTVLSRGKCCVWVYGDIKELTRAVHRDPAPTYERLGFMINELE